ncbi:MAG: AEC family transporter [Clostridia bacterium]|nr:AEC family transporter [Clostridia bacterium]
MFLNVFAQVSVLMILIALGFLAGKIGFFNESGAKTCGQLVMYFVTPCVIIKSLMMRFDAGVLRSMAISFSLTLLLFIVTILFSHFLLHEKDVKRERVLRFAAVFSNCGFMGLPLQEALLGDEGVLYGSVYVVLFNIVVWSYGIRLMSGDRGSVSPKRLLINPGITSLLIGLTLFLFSVPVPAPLRSAVSHMAAMNTPLPMLIIGYHLSQSRLLAAFRSPKALFAIFLRMVGYPFASLGLLWLLGVRGVLLISLVISVSAPSAALTAIFSVQYDDDTELSVNLVSTGTLLSMITMPLVITAAKCLA